MTKTHAIELETTTLFLFAAAAGIVFAMYFHNAPKVKTVFNLPVIAPFVSPTPTQPPSPTVNTFSQLSPNGGKKVTMTMTTTAKGNSSYVFATSSGDGTNQQNLYTINLPKGESMSLPFNAFSPDNNYVFLEHDTQNGSEALVFRTDGQPLSASDTYYNVTTLYNAKQTGNTYQTTTGWASETLLIIDTKTPGGSVQSYWFEVPSKAIIPLATQF